MQNIVYFPSTFTARHVHEALYTLAQVFNWEQKRLPNTIFRIDKIRKMDLLGVVIAYKIIEFSLTHHCFTHASLRRGDHSCFGSAISKYGFKGLLDVFASKDIKSKLYNGLKITADENIIIAPHILNRTDEKSHDNLNKKYYPAIQEHYGYGTTKTLMICQCVSEVILNFWRHATGDNMSVAVAYGDQNGIEIVCIDNGMGVLSSLREVTSYTSLSDKELIRKCVDKSITSKPNTSHTGHGLWLIDQLCKLSDSTMCVMSQGVSYTRRAGKRKVEETGFWKGTIIYLNLRLDNAKTLIDVWRESNKMNN